MSVYTWGSTVHAGLGYLVAHSVKTVDLPRKVALPSSIQSIFAGKTFTVCVCRDGKLVRWGNQFGLLPTTVPTTVTADKAAFCYETGDGLVTERESGMVHEVSADGEVTPLLISGRVVYATDIAAAEPDHWLLVEKGSGALVEVGRPSLSPARLLKTVTPARRVFASSAGVYASESAETGELRIWTNMDGLPRRVVVNRPRSSSMWESSASDFVLTNVVELVLPLVGSAPVAYALINDGEWIVRIPITTEGSALKGHIVDLQCVSPQFVSISQNRDGFLAVSVDGDLLSVPHDAMVAVEPTRLLSQVCTVSVSCDHIAALVRIHDLPSTPPDPTLGVPGLQSICTRVIMTSIVTIDNIVSLLQCLLDRPVVDLPDLLDSCWGFFRLNVRLLRHLSRDAVSALGDRNDVTPAQQCMSADPVITFSDALLQARQRIGPPPLVPDSDETTLPPIPPPTRARPHRPKHLPSSEPQVSLPLLRESRSESLPSQIETPVIAIEVDGDASIFGTDDFIALSESTSQRSTVRPKLGKVKSTKWTKRPVDDSPSVAPWISPLLAPSSPPMASVLVEEEAVVRRREERLGSRSTSSSSRWYVGSDRAEYVSVADVVRREMEEREALEAVRLVEQYERALAAHEAALANERALTAMPSRKHSKTRSIRCADRLDRRSYR